MKNKKIWIVLLHAAVLLVLGLCFFKFSDEMVELKLEVYALKAQAEEALGLTKKPSLEGYDVLHHSGEEWYCSEHLIAHAGGGVDGLDYTNSKEAVELSVQKGLRVLEIDFLYTTDGHLVCVHEWENISDSAEAMTLDAFQAAKICGKYTPMTAQDLIGYMEQWEDLYVVIDTKEEDQVAVTRDLVELSTQTPGVTDRFIVQLYSLDGVKQEILKLYPFSDANFLFTTYKADTSDREKTIQKCYDQNISVISIGNGGWEPEWTVQLRDKGFVLYEYTVNRIDWAETSMNEGIYGFYTDFLTEKDLVFGNIKR